MGLVLEDSLITFFRSSLDKNRKKFMLVGLLNVAWCFFQVYDLSISFFGMN